MAAFPDFTTAFQNGLQYFLVNTAESCTITCCVHIMKKIKHFSIKKNSLTMHKFINIVNRDQ